MTPEEAARLKPGDRICIDGYIGTYKIVSYPAAWDGTAPPLCAEKEGSITVETVLISPWDTWHHIIAKVEKE